VFRGYKNYVLSLLAHFRTKSEWWNEPIRYPQNHIQKRLISDKRQSIDCPRSGIYRKQNPFIAEVTHQMPKI